MLQRLARSIEKDYKIILTRVDRMTGGGIPSTPDQRRRVVFLTSTENRKEDDRSTVSIN
jgi:hypothetical protein